MEVLNNGCHDWRLPWKFEQWTGMCLSERNDSFKLVHEC